ncbi:TetR/AcrR family transcriptional regulator [Tunturiibacter lichenicola]|uniref:TetR/AcrR family transcriptional regulator n=1 Tax=Tunturiibacter lichenicola TaxID=2051959 RepID=UPI0021B21018|nr:TetR/AcrR family transcriptional regulator [Edaphobacter lichenicola]
MKKANATNLSSIASKRDRTRKKLIEAAASVIGEKGFDRASLEEIAAQAGMTRGAVYGNFENKEELFLAVVEAQWKPIMPPFKQGATPREQMRTLGRTVAAEARSRQNVAVLATAFQLYALTHEQTRAKMTERNAIAYEWIAKELVKIVPAKDLHMPAKDFVRILDVVTTGLLFTFFQTPELITERIFVATFESLVPR